MRRLAVALVALAASAAAADPPPVGTGTPVTSGARISAAIDDGMPGVVPEGADDRDHYLFEGVAGQGLIVQARRLRSRQGGLLPVLALHRPDGSLVLPEEGARIQPHPHAGVASLVSYRLDRTGRWTIVVQGGYAWRRVRGDDPSTVPVERTHVVTDYEGGRTEGPYQVSIVAGSAPVPRVRDAVPDDAGWFEFRVPARAGAALTATLRWQGAAPAFTDVRDPEGRTVPGFASRTVAAGRMTVTSALPLEADRPFGDYRFRFAAPAEPVSDVDFSCKVRRPRGTRALRGRFSRIEPRIESVVPAVGGPGVPVVVRCLDAIDPARRGVPRVWVGRHEIPDPEIATQDRLTTFSFAAPDEARLADGPHDVTVASTSGQTVTRPGGFRVLPPPRVRSIDPPAGNLSGGFEIRIAGEGFSAEPLDMEVRYRAPGGTATFAAPVTFKAGSGESLLVFDQPTTEPFSGTEGSWTLSVLDRRSGRSTEVPAPLVLTRTALVTSTAPALVPVTGGVAVALRGGNFRPADRVFLETAPGGGEFEEITATQATYVSPSVHRFTAPSRVASGAGAYRVQVLDEDGDVSPDRTIEFFRLEPATAALGLDEADGYDGNSVVLADLDRDGDTDLVVARRGGPEASATPHTRVFLRDANGKWTDATTAVMPPATSADDWRAEKAAAADVDADGWPDLVLVSSTPGIPAAGSRSHTRILRNEQRSALLPESERAFRDRTADLMAPTRQMKPPLWGSVVRNDPDDWAGHDLWVGDLDLSGAGPPEIVVTTDRVFENSYVSCAPYCASPYSAAYPYSFYWGGTRVFRWDASARGGLGRYAFDRYALPRAGAISVPIFNPPPGIFVPYCAGGACRGTFTPFAGKRLAVGALDVAVPGAPGKARLDLAVLSDQPVTVKGSPVSSLQVALHEPHTAWPGTTMTDVTDRLTAIAPPDLFRGDAVAIGTPFTEDGDPYGVVAVAQRDPAALIDDERALRLIRFRPPAVAADRADFEILSGVLPAASDADRFHAAALAFYDVDRDGRSDLVTLAPSSPGGAAALRLLRNDPSGTFTRTFDDDLVAPLVTATERWEGDALAIGDLDGDGGAAFVVTRAAGGAAPHTRVVRTTK